MSVGLGERVRRLRGRVTGRLESLPILALAVHGACNCRCVMCDIWRANAERRQIDVATLERHVGAIRRLRVRRVMLTGGEPLLHANLWMLCERLRAEGIAITLVTTGLLAGRHAERIATLVDTVVVSLDGPLEIHDAIRRVPGGFARIREGVAALAAAARPPRLVARSVVQRLNCHAVADTIAAARALGVDELSFLAADVSSSAFNRPLPWPEARAAEVAVAAADLPRFAAAIDLAAARHPDALRSGFVAGGVASLRRIHDYYAALAGLRAFPRVRCNAPWISAVLEPDGVLRPCFFQPPYATPDVRLDEALNAPAAIEARRRLDVARDPTCQRCVCSLRLPLGVEV